VFRVKITGRLSARVSRSDEPCPGVRFAHV
jgi:hypothetical protein